MSSRRKINCKSAFPGFKDIHGDVFLVVEIPTGAVYFRLEQYVCKRTKSHKCGWLSIKENIRVT